MPPVKTKLTTIDKAVLSTLVYYDTLDFPLTSFEVFKNLINPKRIEPPPKSSPYRASLLGRVRRTLVGLQPFERRETPTLILPLKKGEVGGGYNKIKLSDIEDSLSHLRGLKIIEESNGFYHLTGRKNLYGLKIERRKLAERKWKKTLSALKFLKVVPYIRLVFASGSLALYNTDAKSDLDVFLVVKSGRIWTARFLISLVLELLGVRRSRYDAVGADKICLNHYITDKFLGIPCESLYTAQLYTHLTPIIIRDNALLNDFWDKNQWVGQYIYNWPPSTEQNLRMMRNGVLIRFTAFLGEKILNSTFGDWFEKKLKEFQLKRIGSDSSSVIARSRLCQSTDYGGRPAFASPAGEASAGKGRIVVSDFQLEFHPDSPEAGIIDRYNKKMKELGFEELGKEEDSGLI